MKITLKSFSLLAAFTIASAVAAHAQTLLNGGFSDVSPHSPNPVSAGGYEQSVPPNHFTGETGFTNNGNQTGGVLSDTLYSGMTSSPTPYDLYLQPDLVGNGTTIPYSSGSPGVDGVYQDLGALQADTTYTVGVYESTGGGSSYGQGATTFALDLYNGTDNSTTPVAETLTPTPRPSTNPDTFNYETVSYTTGATVSGDLTLGLSAYNVYVSANSPDNQTANQVFFADATLSASALTPEPSAWALMLLGLGGLALGLRQRAARIS